jgi:hypothetical protein
MKWPTGLAVRGAGEGMGRRDHHGSEVAGAAAAAGSERRRAAARDLGSMVSSKRAAMGGFIAANRERGRGMQSWREVSWCGDDENAELRDVPAECGVRDWCGWGGSVD